MSLSESVRQQVIDAANAAAQAASVDVYDIEIPKYPGGILRIDLWRANEPLDAEGKRKGVLLDECAIVSKAFDEAIQGLGLYDEDYVLEVSSPGVNRGLRTPEHFKSAVGESAEVILNEVIAGADKGLGKKFVGKVEQVKSIPGGDTEISFLLEQKTKKKQKRSPSAGKVANTPRDHAEGVISVSLSNVKEAWIYFNYDMA